MGATFAGLAFGAALEHRLVDREGLHDVRQAPGAGGGRVRRQASAGTDWVGMRAGDTRAAASVSISILPDTWPPSSTESLRQRAEPLRDERVGDDRPQDAGGVRAP